MGAKSPSPSFFCAAPLFGVFAHLWAAVGRQTGRWVSPGYDRLPESVGYSVWRHFRDQTNGAMGLVERLRWSLPDLARTAKLAKRLLRHHIGSSLRHRSASPPPSRMRRRH
jgi:hypothetical protein